MPELPRRIALNLGLAALYVLAARLGLTLDPVSGFATLVWPPTGIALAAVLLLGSRVAPGIFLGAFLVNLLAGASVPIGIGIGIGNAGEALVGAALLRRVPRFGVSLERVTSVIWLVLGAAMMSTWISATVGVASLHFGGIVGTSRMLDTWQAWWIGDMVGCLLFAPLILVWSTAPRARRDIHWFETTALVVALAVVSTLTFFSGASHVPTLATPFHQVNLLVAVLFWAAIRFGQRGATTAVLCVSLAAIVATTLRYGPFALPELNRGLLLLQTFMAIIAATCLLFAATIAERRVAMQELGTAKQAADTANRARSQFLAVMSHELRTPLNAISGFAELLSTGVYGPLNEKQNDAVKRIVKNEEDLLSLINELLGFVEIDKRQPATTKGKDVRVADALDAAASRVAAQVERKHLVFQRLLPPSDLAVRADPGGLQQILASFLSNAVKYTADGGAVTVGADRDGDKVRIWVTDAGVGIDKKVLERVFEPFFQTESGTTRRYSGIGLGLTIARDLARRMAGEVTIASELGKGTTVAVVLPAAREPGTAAAPADVRTAA